MVLCNQMVANYFTETETIAFRWWLIISQSTGTIQTYGVLQSEGGLLFPGDRDHCNQVVDNYFPENEITANRRWHIISQRTRPLQSEGGLLFTREREIAIRMWLNISQRTRPLHSDGGLYISQRTGTFQTYGALQSDGSLLFHRERDHCNQKVVYYFPENETIAFRW